MVIALNSRINSKLDKCYAFFVQDEDNEQTSEVKHGWEMTNPKTKNISSLFPFHCSSNIFDLKPVFIYVQILDRKMIWMTSTDNTDQSIVAWRFCPGFISLVKHIPV